jgi:hypothetical protein
MADFVGNQTKNEKQHQTNQPQTNQNIKTWTKS